MNESNNVSVSISRTKEDYNKIFEKFVGDIDNGNQANLRGLLAYGLYKVAKREWVSAYRKKEGTPPSLEDLQRYAETWTQSQIESAFDRADQILAEYADVVVGSAEPLILKRALQGSFWRGVLQSITASFLYTLLLVGIATILAVAGVDIVSIFQNTKNFAN